MAKSVSPDLYERYEQLILEMSLAIQMYRGTALIRKDSYLSDLEIAERLGLPVEDVPEIRCIAEIDLVPPERWMASDDWKRVKARHALVKRKEDG